MSNDIKSAQNIMDTNPDSALHLLQHIQSSRTLTTADRAIFGIIYFQALDKMNKPLTPDSIIDFSMKYYQNENDKEHLATAYYYKARLYKAAQQFDQATYLYLKTLDLIQNNKNYLLLAKINSDLGDICSIQMEYKAALIKYKESNKWFQLAGDTINACYKIIDIARVYSLMNENSKAQENFRKVLRQTNDSLIQGTAYQGIGIDYYQIKNYDSAQFFLRKSLTYPYKGTNYAIRCNILADLKLDIHQLDSSYFYATKALKYPSTFFNQRDCYRILANTEYLKKNFKQMAFYMTKYQDCSDSVQKVQVQTKTTVLESLHQTSENATHDRNYLMLVLWFLPVIILISLYSIFIFRKRNKGKDKELKEVSVELQDNQHFLVHTLLQKLEDTKETQQSIYKKATVAQREQMDKDVYNQCLHLNNWDEFKKLMNKTFNNIITNLENNYTEITRKELIWTCLFLLNIPTNDILLILEYKLDSLYKLKQRMVQKLNLKNAKALDSFITEMAKRKC